MSLWKTTAAVLIGLAAQGCGFLKEFTDSSYKRNVELYMMRTADRMAYDDTLRRLAYEQPLGIDALEENEIYEKEGKRVFKKAGHAALKGFWNTFTSDTPLEGIIEPSFKDEEGRTIHETLTIPAERDRRSSRSRLGFMPVVRIGDEVGGGIKARNFSALVLRGDDYWEYKAHARLLGLRLAGEFHDYDEDHDRYKFGIGRGPLSLSFSEGPDGEKEYWLEFFK